MPATTVQLVRVRTSNTRVVYARIARSRPLLPSHAYFGTKILVRAWPDWPDRLLRPWYMLLHVHVGVAHNFCRLASKYTRPKFNWILPFTYPVLRVRASYVCCTLSRAIARRFKHIKEGVNVSCRMISCDEWGEGETSPRQVIALGIAAIVIADPLCQQVTGLP